jgi:hypothetical protein
VPDRISQEAVVRSLTEGAAEVLERIAAIPLSSGRVNLIAIDAIAEAFGPRWSGKKAQVYEHVDRILHRAVGADGFAVRVSSTDFLVVLTDIGPFAAQAVCYRTFHEIWTHFLGKAPVLQHCVHRVTELTGQQITAIQVDPAAALAGEAQELAEAAALAKAREDSSPLSAHRWTPFVASNGRRVDVDCHLEPVFNLKTNTRIALRLRRRVIDLGSSQPLHTDEVALLSRSDLFRIDMGTMSRALTHLQEMEGAGSELSLIVPGSYIPLSNPVSRQTFTKGLDELRAVVRMGIIFELRDLAGAPHATIAEILAALRPQCLLIAAHLSADPPPRSLKELDFQAISVVCPKSIDGDAQFIGWLRPWIRSAQFIARSVMIYRCVEPRRMAIAHALKASHCSGPGRTQRQDELAALSA